MPESAPKAEWSNLPLPTMFMVNNHGEKFLCKNNKEFITSMKDYLVQFGYPTVTEDEVRKCLYEIFCEGKTGNSDVVHQIILTYIEPKDIGKYKQYAVK